MTYLLRRDSQQHANVVRKRYETDAQQFHYVP